jgi:uncharacterized protein
MSKTTRFVSIPIKEQDTFGQQMIQAETAVPAFIGYTQKATLKGKDLFNKTATIYSLSEFTEIYGFAPSYAFSIQETTDQEGIAIAGKLYETVQDDQSRFWLYNSIRLFYANGGGKCHIVSLGDYNSPKNAADFYPAIDLLKKVYPVTLLVIPELMLLSEQECAKLQQYMVAHCGSMGDRMALLDIYNGYQLPRNDDKDVISRFRKNLPDSGLDCVAAYYPWVDTSVCSSSELSFKNISSMALFKQLLLADGEESLSPDQYLQLQQLVNTGPGKSSPEKVHEALLNLSPCYKSILNSMLKVINRLAPSAAIAGIYTRVDNDRGVWKAPANVGINKVTAPAVRITDDLQADLNVPLSGKAINAIRSFIGEGVLIWGARTCDGNSSDWRYISVRRTATMIEQSIKAGLRSFVFEPNNQQTWQIINATTQNFMNSLWKQGALAGATPSDAYTVNIGMGSTMTGDEVVNGILRLNVAVALARPAEFIVFTFMQQQQTA